MPVNAQHPQYTKFHCRWDLVRSVVHNDAQHWIRTVDKNDPERSRQYKQDAILTNFTALTKTGLTGLVFRRLPKVTLPTSLEYLMTDATGDDLPLDQMSQSIADDILQTGRYGLLVDYPKTDEPQSKYDLELSGNSARFKCYRAEDIINWQTTVYGNKKILSMVVLRECVDGVDSDGYTWMQKQQFRVLKLTPERVYEQYLLDENENVLDYAMPQDMMGKTFDTIPFTFIGSKNNDPDIDASPLYDLAVLNLGHYRNSADNEESIYICGQPYLTMGGDASMEDFKANYPDGIKFGARAGSWLGSNSWANLLQANQNQMVAQAMKDKLDQALAIGARLIAPPGGRETAEAAKIRFSSQNSALYMITKNISHAITKCLYWAQMFMSKEEQECEFILNDQFYDETADPNLIAQQIMLLDRGIIAPNDVRDYAKKTGFVRDSRTDEQIDDEAEKVSPIGEDDAVI